VAQEARGRVACVTSENELLWAGKGRCLFQCTSRVQFHGAPVASPFQGAPAGPLCWLAPSRAWHGSAACRILLVPDVRLTRTALWWGPPSAQGKTAGSGVLLRGVFFTGGHARQGTAHGAWAHFRIQRTVSGSYFVCGAQPLRCRPR